MLKKLLPLALLISTSSFATTPAQELEQPHWTEHLQEVLEPLNAIHESISGASIEIYKSYADHCIDGESEQSEIWKEVISKNSHYISMLVLLGDSQTNMYPDTNISVATALILDNTRKCVTDYEGVLDQMYELSVIDAEQHKSYTEFIGSRS